MEGLGEVENKYAAALWINCRGLVAYRGNHAKSKLH